MSSVELNLMLALTAWVDASSIISRVRHFTRISLLILIIVRRIQTRKKVVLKQYNIQINMVGEKFGPLFI